MKIIAFMFLFFSLGIGAGSAQERNPCNPPSRSLPNIEAYKDLVYVPGGDKRQSLDLYVPARSDEPLPLIVWIHGGGWKYGSKNVCPVLAWTQKGYVVASINYRLSRDAKFPAQIRDCEAAIGWLREKARKYHIDRDRVVAWGESAGGHLASLVGTAWDAAEWDSRQEKGTGRVEAVIDWYGRSDLTPVSTNPAFADSPSAFLLGGCGDEVARLSREASPILHVSKDDPPFLIMHGDQDKVVPLRQSQAFAEALKKVGVKVKLLVLKGIGHGGRQFLAPEQVDAIDTFLNEHLGRHKLAGSYR
jgi:acetyl esterase/lipase